MVIKKPEKEALIKPVWPHVQALEACDHNLDAAVPEYERRRLPEARALAKLDLKALARVGNKGTPWWNLDYLGAKLHVLLAVALKKLAPQLFKGPEMYRLMGERMPYRQVSPACSLTLCLLLVHTLVVDLQPTVSWLPCY